MFEKIWGEGGVESFFVGCRVAKKSIGIYKKKIYILDKLYFLQLEGPPPPYHPYPLLSKWILKILLFKLLYFLFLDIAYSPWRTPPPPYPPEVDNLPYFKPFLIGHSKSWRISQLHHWYKLSVSFLYGVSFAYCWRCIGKGCLINGFTPSSLFTCMIWSTFMSSKEG